MLGDLCCAYVRRIALLNDIRSGRPSPVMAVEDHRLADELERAFVDMMRRPNATWAMIDIAFECRLGGRTLSVNPTSTSLMIALQNVSFKNVVLISIAIRVLLIFYSEWHDKHAVVKYTDIDYRVFTDAAQYLMHPFSTLYGNDNIAKGPLGQKFVIGE